MPLLRKITIRRGHTTRQHPRQRLRTHNLTPHRHNRHLNPHHLPHLTRPRTRRIHQHLTPNTHRRRLHTHHPGTRHHHPSNLRMRQNPRPPRPRTRPQRISELIRIQLVITTETQRTTHPTRQRRLRDSQLTRRQPLKQMPLLRIILPQRLRIRLITLVIHNKQQRRTIKLDINRSIRTQIPRQPRNHRVRPQRELQETLR